MTKLRGVLAVLAGVVLLGGVARGEGGCEGEWSNQFRTDGLNGDYEVIELDFGSGPQLFAYGRFNNAHGSVPTAFAVWVDGSWRGVDVSDGDPIPTLITTVVAHHGASEQLLRAAGKFRLNDGQVIDAVGQYDGVTWQLLPGAFGSPNGVSFKQLLQAPIGGATRLVVLGQFNAVDGIACDRVAWWNGAQWVPLSGTATLGAGPTAQLSLHLVDFGGVPTLTMCSPGSMWAQGASAGGVVIFDGIKWAYVWDGVFSVAPSGEASVSLIQEGKRRLYIWGSRPNPDLTAGPSGLWAWSGTGWLYLGDGGLRSITKLMTLKVDGADRLVAFRPRWTNGASAPDFLLWTGTGWEPFLAVGAPQSYTVQSVAQSTMGDRIWAVSTQNRLPASTLRLLELQGNAWQPIDEISAYEYPSSVTAMAPFVLNGVSSTIVAGKFEVEPGVNRDTIKAWDGESWRTLGWRGFDRARAFALHDDSAGTSLYSGYSEVKKWDGDEWRPVGNAYGSVNGLLSFTYNGRNLLLAYGSRFIFYNEYNEPYAGLIAWDGESWSRFGPPLSDRNGTSAAIGEVVAAAMHDDGSGNALFIAAGIFDPTRPPFQRTTRIFKLDGRSWVPLPELSTSLTQTTIVRRITSYHGPGGDCLIVAGRWWDASRGRSVTVAMLDQGVWRPLLPASESVSSPFTTANEATAITLGGRRLLAVSGDTVSGVGAKTMAALWDGSSWTTIQASGVSSVVAVAPGRRNGRRTMTFGGRFYYPPGSNDINFSQLTFCESPCPADVNADGRTDGRDLTQLLSNFGKRNWDPMFLPDVNTDGVVDGRDLAVLLGTFGSTCE